MLLPIFDFSDLFRFEFQKTHFFFSYYGKASHKDILNDSALSSTHLFATLPWLISFLFASFCKPCLLSNNQIRSY